MLYPAATGDAQISDIKINSKECRQGDIFICTMGATADRHDFVEDAIAHGASAVVASRPVEERVHLACEAKGIPVIPIAYVENTNAELPYLAQRLFDDPEKKMRTVGITGTNGKTTVATMIAQMIGMEAAGTIGTTGIRCAAFDEPIRNSCPDADRLYKYLKRFLDAGCGTVTMEATSEALAAGRLRGMTYDTIIFTNITQDHLNTHGTIENYVKAKLMLLEHLKTGGSILLNTEDLHFAEELAAAEKEVEKVSGKILTYGKAESADLRILSSHAAPNGGMQAELSLEGRRQIVLCPLQGEYNVYNMAAAVLALTASGYPFEDACGRVHKIETVPGRGEFLSFGQPFRIVLDYAHTPDALEKVLTMLQEIKTGRIITLTGSAGGREKEKRPAMGRIVLTMSDLVIFTMDDPRTEDVNAIIDDLISGAPEEGDYAEYIRIPDRVEAIAKAFSLAKPEDIVLVAGKGRDNYMAVGHEYLPYSDYDTIAEYFKEN